MTLDVFGEMIRSHESPLADRADELLFSRVRAFVAGQLVGSGEPTAAVCPLADEGPFTGVNPLMGLQVAGFEVVFATVWVFALVDSSALGLLGDTWDAGGRGGVGVDGVGRLRNQQRLAVALDEQIL